MERTAIVTGGTRGIGAAISKTLKYRGIAVAATYVGNDEQARMFSAESSIPVFKWDVSDTHACADGVAEVEKQLGPVDIVVNNAGITRDATLLKMSYDDWKQVIDTNLGGCFNMAKATFSGMKDRKWGRFVNIGSVNGQAGQFGQVNYSAAKAGIQGFAKALALEGARYGVTANTITPGYADTDMVRAVPEHVLEGIVGRVPVKRLCQPQEVASAVAYLCSDEASFITGATIPINGGLYMP